MTNIDLRFTGYANFKQVQGQVSALQKQFASLNASQAAAARGGKSVASSGYMQQQKVLKSVSATYADLIRQSGKFDVSQHKAASATQKFTRDLQGQKLTLRQITSQRKLYNEVLKEQIALQRASMMTAGGVTTVATPRGMTNAISAYDQLRVKAGMAATAMKSASTQMINFGKNTQWSGRQISSGFTMPLLALAAVSGKVFYDIDKNLTDIAKVYDTNADVVGSAAQKQASREMELNQLRNDGFATATSLAQRYGAAAKDTLDVQAQLAATGLRGADLQANTNAVMRQSILGQFDYQKALDSSIALQSIYGYSSKELADNLNYMNAIENATSLSMEDFAEAVPIASGPLKVLGADLKDVGLLLTAMKERGVGAVQGANALKSGLTRLYRPSKQVQAEFAALTGKTIPELTEKSKGELIPMLKEVGEAVKNLTPAERTKALAGLFGTYQVSRLSSLLDGLTSQSAQVTRALDVAANSTEQNATIAQNELAAQAESASGKFRRAYASIQIELAKTGEAFLNVGTVALQTADKFFELYSALPGPIKFFLKTGIVVGALVGPLLMLVGLFGNLIGQGIRVVSFLTLAATGFKALTREEVANNGIQNMAIKGLGAQAIATKGLTDQVNLLTAALQRQRSAQSGVAAGVVPSSSVRRDPTTLTPQQQQAAATRRRPPKPQGPAPSSASALPGQGTSLYGVPNPAAEKERTQQMGRQAVYAGAMSASMVMMMQPWSHATQEAGKYLMIMSIAVPLISTLPAIWTAVATRAAAARLAMVGTGGAVGKTGALLRAGVGTLNLWAVGIAAAAAGFIYLRKKTAEAAKEVKNTYEDTEGLGKILGYTPSEKASAGPMVDGVQKESIDKVKQFNTEYAGVVKKINQAKGDQAKLNVAMAQGLKVINSGGTAEQAKEAVKLALEASQSTADANRIMLKFDTDFSNTEAVLKAQMAQAQNLATQLGQRGKEGLNRGFMETMTSPSAWGTYFKSYGQSVGISDEAKEYGKQTGNAFATGMLSSLNASKESQKQATADLLAGMDTLLGSGSKEEVAVRNEALKAYLVSTGRLEEEAGKVTENLGKQSNIQKIILNESYNISSAQREQLNIVGGITGAHLELIRLEGGKTSATNNTNSALAKQLQYASLIESQLEKNAKGEADWGTTYKKIYQDSMTSAWNAYGSFLGSQVDAHFQSQLDATQAKGERASAALDASIAKRQAGLEKRQDRAQQKFEERWKKRKAALEAEENLRQKAFQAEVLRIERQKAMKNASTDYGSAIATGDLDAAAKIRNDATAEQDTWALEDSDEKAKAAYEAAMKRLADREAKEKASLDRRQKAEKAALDRRNAAEKAALAEANRAAQASAAQQIEINKQKVQSMLAADLAYVPTSEAEAKKYIASLQTKYSKMGIDLSAMSARYGTTLHDTLTNSILQNANDLKTKIDWAGLANSAATKYVKQIWGMSLQSFLKWVDVKTSNKSTAPVKGGKVNGTAWNSTVNHGGGFIGGGSTGRAGYSKLSGPMHSEQMTLAQKGEFLVQKKAAQALGSDALSKINNAHRIKNRTDGQYPGLNQGGAGMSSVDANSLGSILNLGTKKAIQALGKASKARDAAAKAVTSGGATVSGKDLKVSGGGWMRPWRNKAPLTQGFHEGKALDYGVPSGTKLYAPTRGKVSRSYDIPSQPGRRNMGGYGSYGRVVETTHPGGVRLSMAHMSSRGVKSGQAINKGSYLGKSGNTGNSGGPHVHFMAYKNGNMVDPRALFGSNGVSLRKGGELKYDNTMVNAHKGETMLTSNLTEHFKRGVENYANSKPGNSYGDIIVQVPAGTKDPQAFGRAAALSIKKELDYEESRYGK